MTTTHNPAPAADSADAETAAIVDEVLTERCESSAQYLAGLIAKGTLDSVSRPGKLPELMFPDINPWDVRTVWDAALAVGYAAGKAAARPEWTAEGLDRLRAALSDAGYQGMARLTARTATVHQPRAQHPDHADTVAETPAARPGGHQ